jgi:hypothetical protein
MTSTDESPGIMQRMVPAYLVILCLIAIVVIGVSAFFLGLVSVSTPATGSSSIVLVAASSGGIIVGLLLGILIGRRR